MFVKVFITGNCKVTATASNGRGTVKVFKSKKETPTTKNKNEEN